MGSYGRFDCFLPDHMIFLSGLGSDLGKVIKGRVMKQFPLYTGTFVLRVG